MIFLKITYSSAKPKFSVFPKNFRYFRCSSHSTLHASRFTLHAPRFPSPSGELEGGLPYSDGYSTFCPS